MHILKSTNKSVYIFITGLFLAAVLTAACAAASPQSRNETALMPAPMEKSMEASPEFADSVGAEEIPQESNSETITYSDNNASQSVERIIIRNARLSIAVPDPPSAMDDIAKMADDMGGFVVSGNIYYSTLENGEKVPYGRTTIRVPAELFNDAITQIKALSSQDPLNQSIESQDVTSEYTDLQSRLRNLESAEEQLQEIMDKAYDTEDVMRVFNQLVQVQEQIEIIKGQIKYYEQSSAYSAIEVELEPDEAVQPLTIGGWQPAGVAKKAVQALINALEVLVNFSIWMVVFFIPLLIIFLIVVGIPIYLIIKFINSRSSKKKVKEENKNQEK
jgi:hypothetical protein